ncbi:hypothetical protein PMV_050 [Port-miou virus]|uniref:Uncharacterized protein n=1 Tax=Port-miou virus TaxID=1733873 RepID=A0A0N9PW06_9VIRU|nr:hypothetical protein PMV_050 [Port-miou virus]
MEPITQEKLEALREHVQTLRDYLDVLRLDYDTCESKKKRAELLQEITRLEAEIDPLYCDLLAAEDAALEEISRERAARIRAETSEQREAKRIEEVRNIQKRMQHNKEADDMRKEREYDEEGNTKRQMQKFLAQFPMYEQNTKNIRVYPEDETEEDLSLQPAQQSWIGRLVTDYEGKDVFRVMHVAEGYVRLEKQRLLHDPIRWISLENKPLMFGRDKLLRLLSGSEIFFPLSKKTEKKEGTLSPFWMGKLVQKNGNLFRLMSKCSQAGAWKVCDIKRTENGALLEGETWYICEDSMGWKLADEEEMEGTLRSAWVGKIVKKNGKVYRLISRDSEKGICEVVERRLAPNKAVIESPVFRVLCTETGWSLALDKGKDKI